MEYTFTWRIENYSYCWHNTEEVLNSPVFYACGLKSSAWYLSLYPRADRVECMGWISLFLYRNPVDNGQDNISIKYDLSFLKVDGSHLQTAEEVEHTFEKGEGHGYFEFLAMNEVLLRQNANYLPQDTLSVRCKLWMENGDNRNMGQCFARTRIEIEQLTFLHVIGSFSTLEPNQKKNMEIKISPEQNCKISSIYLTDSPCCNDRIMMEITPSNPKQIISKCKFFLIDATGNVVKCGEEDNRFEYTRKDIRKLPLSLSKKVILEKEDEYLVDDKLTLLCECTFSTGEIYEKIERILHEVPSEALKQISNDTERLSAYRGVLADDLKELYNTQLLTDVELRTKTKSFRSHKNLLCARSPVFKAMLTNDMKEKYSNCIQVDDLGDDTLEKFLHFLYSDNIGIIQKDSAIKLYYAADKYAVEKLKLMCSSILTDCLDTSNVIELLLLADTHNDCHLQKAVEDFILEHEEEVFGSDEWGNLIEINPILVSKTMRLKYTRKI